MNTNTIKFENVFCEKCGKSYYDVRLNEVGDLMAIKKGCMKNEYGEYDIIARRRIVGYSFNDLEKLFHADDDCRCNIWIEAKVPISMFMSA